jgi:hypothetical protein
MPPLASDTVCGPNGDDANCDMVVGNCDTQTVYVGLKVNDPSDCTTKIIDSRMSTIEAEIPADYLVRTEFKSFKQKPLGTGVIDLNTCTAGAGKHQVSFGTNPCAPGGTEFKSLGYIATKQTMGYEQLLVLSYQGITAAVPPSASATGNLICCHATTCSAVNDFVPPP